MDILTHTLSGVAVGTVVSSFSKVGFKEKLKIIIISGLAGALPDIDAISLWSGFDSTFGEFFRLSKSGREIYSAKYWYSHHAFFHSITAGMLFTFILGGISLLINRIRSSNFSKHLYNKRLLLLGFLFGYLIHLIEDMPTPSSTWGGVNFLWPYKTYIGGTGDIWWWNNYDVFLIVVFVILINILIQLIQRFISIDTRKLTVIFFVLGTSLVITQIKTRSFDFAYNGYSTNYQNSEIKSKQIQKEILGVRLYQLMEGFDNKLKIYF